MNVIDLIIEMGIQPKRTASTNGGEHHSQCPHPDCGGKDRFCVWPSEGTSGRYWCRQCNRSGDAIEFCRDFMKMSYVDACEKVGMSPKLKSPSPYPRKTYFNPSPSNIPSARWFFEASGFIDYCIHELEGNQRAKEYLRSRGLTPETISTYKLGWNPVETFSKREKWGLPIEKKVDGKEKMQWLPKGIVIPTFNQDKTIKIKVRRSHWHPHDKLPKYVEVSGGCRQLSFYGKELHKPIVIMESEIDAILTQQFASDICNCVALGGAGKKPDLLTHRILLGAPLLLLSLDFDEAGKKASFFWKDTYPNLIFWPVPKGKSPGDAFKEGIDLRKWVINGEKKAKI